MKYMLKYQGATLLWAALIFVLCIIRLGDVDSSTLFFAGFDKLVHCGLFFVLATLMCCGMLKANGNHRLTLAQQILSFLTPIIFGGIIELLQAYIFTRRSGDWGDLFADSIGAAMSIFSMLIVIWSIKDAK